MEFNSDIFSLLIKGTFKLKSEFVDGKVSFDFNFCSDNVNVVDHLKIEFVDDMCGMFFESSNFDFNVVLPEGYSNSVIIIEVYFEFMNQYFKSEFQFRSLVFVSGLEFKNKNSNHFFEFNLEAIFKFRIMGKDVVLVGFKDEYLFFSEDIKFNYEFKFDIDAVLFVLSVESDSPFINIKDPVLFFFFHQ